MRDKFLTRKLLLVGSMQADTAIQVIKNAPLDPANPIEVIIREQVKTRGLDANALMWAVTLKDIAEQAWVDGKRFSAEVWHHHFKIIYLPEEFEEGITKDGYRKWDVTPSGERVLVGSTAHLTTKGFANYLTQIEADGANMGVMYSAREAA